MSYIGGILGTIDVMMNHPCATDEDKKGFDQIKIQLHGKEVVEIEHRLADADVRRDILDMIDKLKKRLAEIRQNDLQL